MEISEIPSDVIVQMIDEWHQQFSEDGCNPTCHKCVKPLAIGDKFKLSSIHTAIKKGSGNYNHVTSTEIMLCDGCDVSGMNAEELEKITEEMKRRALGGGCFRVNGAIVTALNLSALEQTEK